MVGMTGIEPAWASPPDSWSATDPHPDVYKLLGFLYTFRERVYFLNMWSPRPGFNRRPSPYKGAALALSYRGVEWWPRRGMSPRPCA